MKLTGGGNYLKAQDVNRGDVVKFMDEGKIETSEKYTYEDGTPKKSFVFTVEHMGKSVLMRINKASRVALIAAWGDETKNWIGKQATCFTMPTPDGTKKMIILEPVLTDNQEF